MKKALLFLLLTLVSLVSFGDVQTTLTSATESMVNITVDIPGFITTQVTTPRGEAMIVSIPKTVSVSAAGEPQLPLVVIPVAIDDNALMQVVVTGSNYTDYEGIELAPSKGDFPRSINPEDVPYTYGPAYQQDAFFPSVIAKLDEPYIHRDVRGQNIMLSPIVYNPVTKVMRVYHHIELSMMKVGIDSRNVIVNRTQSFKLDPEFKAIYESRYINFSQSMGRYASIADDGELLIICHDDFMTAMEPFVAWKKQIGRHTTMVGTSETGTTATAIKAYIQNYYNEHPELTDILLVGDVDQIPGVYISAGTGIDYNYSGYGDLQYGQLAGNDYYNEVIVGRFCCETEAQVINHVNKVLNYERDLDETATWLTVGQGVSTSAGPYGHYNEDDYVHVDNLRNDLLNYHYTNVYRDYKNVTGTTASNASVVSQHINEGVSIINYCNHGSEQGWLVFSYSNSNVNALVNDYKLPYIISVACLNGKYDHNGGCFAEAWMRATNNTNGNPTGAIGGMFSYISQPWIPPMYGQDEMIDIIVESYSDNIRRTMGGVSINGDMKILDLGPNANENKGTYNNWVLYGDPTLTLRNAVPTIMTVNAPDQITRTAQELTLTATDAEGALATLTFNGEILGSATIVDGTATIEFQATETIGTATLTVFGYNKKTFITTVEVTDGSTTDCPTAANFSGTAFYEDGEFGARLAWDKADYEFTLDRFEIYRSDGTPEFKLVKRIVNTPSISHYETTDYVNTPGLYTYRIITFYQDGCESDYSEVEVEILDLTAVDEQLAKSVAVYPNPTTGQITVASENLRQINIINSLGQTLRSITADDDLVTIDLSAFGKGIYMLTIQTESGVSTKRIIVE